MHAADRPQALGILLAADDPLARLALARVVAEQPGLRLVGQASTPVGWRPEGAGHPSVVLWDLGLSPDRALARLADALARDVPVLALVPAPEAAGPTLAAGARGVLPREVGGEALAAALQAAAQGLVVLDPGMLQALLPAREPQALLGPDELTPREREVLELLVAGLANKAIGERLGISEHTAKFHANAIMAKLGVQRRAEVALRAARLGLVTL